MNPKNWTLRTRLIALMVALVAVTSVVIGGVMAIVVRQSFTTQFSSRVVSTAQNFGHMVADSNDPTNAHAIDATDLVFAVNTVSGWQAYRYTGSSTAVPLTVAQTSSISAIQSRSDQLLRPGDTRDVVVPGYGEYRFAPVYGAGTALLVGLPTSQLYKGIAQVIVPIVVVVLLSIVLAGILGAFVIRGALRPLRRVATVASNVAGMRLERGSVHLAQRVPAEDTNPHTEVGQVGSALNNLLDSVETALAVRQASEDKVRTFVADASHELRTPLASIRGYAELTRRFGGELSDDVQHNIARIESESQRMTSLVEDLLLLARLDAQRELDTADVDLSRLLVDVVSDAHAAGPDHEWDLELPDEPVTVRGDDLRLHQVFANLLTNARVHTPGGTRVVVELARPGDDTVEVRVRDTGPGIPAELQPTLFERFVRGDSSRNRRSGSTGLGLSIVHAVVTAHHGSVRVESEPGSTVFIVRLPVHQPAQAAPKPEPQPALA
ncbi:HAMP domain-containing sensor histidine kinase [Amnibacterium sp.]|uniref:sensor histidine kinase n=1 Tax=Amnibacterium sp. TaxID=1872496 RepID=UPI002606DEAE|nr:HAMP domain-containing sensor histidine kinase [Amnibacterium sp.]MCU1472489.1 Histidine kinase [Amnibacterium sp.]